MNEKEVISFLSAFGSPGLVEHWHHLNSDKKRRLQAQISQIDLPTLRLQQQLAGQQEKNIHKTLSPFKAYAQAGNPEDIQRGKEALAQGEAGCLVVAGGQGSRLRISGPKGMCQVTAIRKKSLFQLLAEKTIAAGRQVGRLLPLAIMTSPLNHTDTVSFFESHALFGLDPSQVSFFSQDTLPFLDQHGHLFLETPDTLAEGPDGNGGVLRQFMRSGIWDKWLAAGVRYVNFVLIDNPLADPFDAELIGYQKRRNGDAVIKCTYRKNPDEKVGVIVQEHEKAVVVEYTELPKEEQIAIDAQGSLRHLLANLSLFLFDMSFIHRVANASLPLHKAFKAVKYLNSKGEVVQADHPMAWKFERFIFDVLPLGTKVEALVYPRERCFAPLKNFSGDDSLESVSRALQHRDRQVLGEVTGLPCQAKDIEISQDFYYPTDDLLRKWRGRPVTQTGYIDRDTNSH